MYFADDALLPENQDELIINVAPYGPEWLPGDFPEDIAITLDEQVQKAVDCWNAGATSLHIHVREADGKGSKRLSMFNELIGRLRDRLPKMVLQVGGSISFSPEGEGDQAKWLNYDTRHMLAELTPKPDQVTIAINSLQMNITELLHAGRRRGHAVRGSRGTRCVGGDGGRRHAVVLHRAPEAAARQRHPAVFHARQPARSSRPSSGWFARATTWARSITATSPSAAAQPAPTRSR